jgi:hypothetical protein
MTNKNKKELVRADIDVYETEIEFTCPVRGLIKQKVKVKRLKSVDVRLVSDIRHSKSLADELDLKYSGLNLNDNELNNEDEL